jgi:hypothetical protein
MAEEKRKVHKQVTQAVAEQPQEEFISPDNSPSKDVSEVGESPPAKDQNPPAQR